MDPLEAFRSEANTLLENALRSVGYDGDVPSLETPPEPGMGDLGMPMFQLAKALKMGPPQIAAKVTKAIDAAGAQWVKEARAFGPYCNLFLDEAKLAAAVLANPSAAMTCEPTGERILLEHTSANPNGPLHVGRARNPILGDSLNRLFRAAGHTVESQYYMDNLGRQVALLSWGKWNIKESELPPVPEERDGKPDHVLVRYYQAATERMKENPETAMEIKQLVTRLEDADESILPKVREVYGACFAGMQASLSRLGIAYDSIKDESDVVTDGSVGRTVQKLKELPRAAVEEDGANYLDLSDVLKGQKDKFFFTRKDGTSVYATRDIAYHAWKAEQVGDGRLVNVLGEDHRLQALQVGTALDELGVQRPHVVFYAFVSLPEGKMSTRANRVVFVDDLLDEAVALARDEVGKRRGDDLDGAELDAIAEAVGIGAIRFNIARVQPEKPIKFRWEEALNFDGDSAPYLMYAFARGASLRRAAEAAGIKPMAGTLGVGEHKLLAKVARMPGAIREAAANYAPHRFCSFALELATAFNEYYRDHRVVGHENAEEAATRLAALEVAHDALDRALDILGLTALESM